MKITTTKTGGHMIIEEKPKPIMKIIVSIKMLLFVMSAHSFNRIFYFLSIRTAFKTNRPKCEWIFFYSFSHTLALGLRFVSISIARLEPTCVSMTHQAQESQTKITSDILLQAFFMFSFYYFVVFFFSGSAWALLIFNSILCHGSLCTLHCCNVSIDVQCSYHTRCVHKL